MVKTRMGRPRKRAEEKRSEHVTVNMTRQQLQTLRAEAARLGLDVGPLMLSASLDRVGQP